MKQSRALTATFVLITAAVGAATIWLACNFVDILHNSLQATKNIHISDDTKVPERGRFDAISAQFSEQIDSMSSNQTWRPKAKGEKLTGSEILYEKALEASVSGKFEHGRELLDDVLKQIPAESKSRKNWYAECKSRDLKMYMAMTHQLRGFCYLNLREYRKAIRDLDQAIALRPAYGPNFTNRGKAHLLLGERDLGNADLHRARQLPAASEDVPDAHALDELAGQH